jgi:hypothetical protein
MERIGSQSCAPMFNAQNIPAALIASRYEVALAFLKLAHEVDDFIGRYPSYNLAAFFVDNLDHPYTGILVKIES